MANKGKGLSPTVDLSCCASCGKSEDAEGIGKLKTCTACKSVKYCSVDCQRNHRKAHKKECKRIEKRLLESELSALDNADDDGGLFKPPPPKEECPLCFLRLPNESNQVTYVMCCGKTICNGCQLKHMSVWNWTNLKRQTKDPPEQPLESTCAFCRKQTSNISDEERLRRVKKRMALNDPEAFCRMASNYFEGRDGLSKDESKAEEMFLRAAELGSYDSCSILAHGFRGRDHFKHMHYTKLGAKRGDVYARADLGTIESKKGCHEPALKHWMISSAAGHDDSLKAIGEAYRNKNATKDQYEEAIRTHQKAKEDMSSFERDMAKKCGVGKLDPSFFSESELAELCGVRESERTLFSHYFAQLNG